MHTLQVCNIVKNANIWPSSMLMSETSGDYCRDELVRFDHSHKYMFEGFNERGEKKYVGGLVRTIRCQVVDEAEYVANTNGHVSTKSQVSCPGESCSSSSDCESYFVEAYCVSRKCQRTGIRPQPNLSGNVEVA